MKQMESDKKLYISLAAVVVLLTVAVYSSLFRGYSKDAKYGGRKGVAAMLSVSSRSPASVEQRMSDFDGATSSTIEISCKNLKDISKVSSSFIRFKSFDCGSPEAFKISNESNGYEAASFRLEDKSVSTEFVDIKEGQNKLTLSYKEGASVETKQFIVHRMVAAQPEN